MNRMRQRKVRNDRALAIIRNLAEFQEDDAIKIADGHTKPAAKKVSVLFLNFSRRRRRRISRGSHTNHLFHF